MDELAVMKKVHEELEKLDPASRNRVLAWMLSKFPEGQGISEAHHEAVKGSKGTEKLPEKRAPKPRRKSKIQVRVDKGLDLNSSKGPSAREFSQEKNPTNAKQKCVIAVYYLSNKRGLEKVSTDHVYTFFKGVGWASPADLINTLHQAGSAGWLDTADAENIMVTPIGENLVEHDLPKKA